MKALGETHSALPVLWLHFEHITNDEIQNDDLKVSLSHLDASFQELSSGDRGSLVTSQLE